MNIINLNINLMKVKNTLFLYVIAIVVAFGSFVFGYSLVCISMMADTIQKQLPMSSSQFDYQLSLITTLLPLGAFLGTFLMQHLCNYLGEHKSMMYLDIYGIIAIILQTYQIQFWNIYAGRFLLGIYVGIASGIVPMYLISISPPQISGIVGSFNQLLITIGIAAAYGIGMMETISWYQYMMIPAVFCAVRFMVLYFFEFDTLERHYRSGQTEKLKKYVHLFYQDGSVEGLVAARNFTDSIKVVSTSDTRQKGLWGWINTLTNGAPRGVVYLAVVLAIANQLSGINAILFYAKQIFQHITNNNKMMALKYTLYLGLLQVLVTFISGFLINRFGRRTLMILGESLVVGSLILGFCFELLMENSQSYITMVVFVHIIGFSLSLGPVSFLYIAQMMENMSLVVIIVWILTLIVSMLSQIMIKTFGIGTVFLFYGSVSFCCLSYIWRYMVESKGLSRGELVSRLQSKPMIKSLEEERVRLHEQNGTTAEI